VEAIVESGRVLSAAATRRKNQMKIKTSLLIAAFSLAFSIAGCTAAPTPGPAGPQGQTGATGATGDPRQDADRRRAEDQKIADDQRRLDDQRHADEQKRVDVAREVSGSACPSGEHIYTNRDGQKSCVRD